MTRHGVSRALSVAVWLAYLAAGRFASPLTTRESPGCAVSFMGWVLLLLPAAFKAARMTG